MSSKAITEKRDDRPAPSHPSPAPEWMPSLIREETPTLSRFVGGAGLFCLILILAARLWKASGHDTWVGQGWTTFLVVMGLMGLLFHALNDRELQVRRLYGVFGMLWLLVGAVLLVLGVVPFFVSGKETLANLFLPGTLGLGVALLFLLAFIRTESEQLVRDGAVRVVGIAGGLFALVSVIGATLALVKVLRATVGDDFLVPNGLMLALVALGYLCAFVGLKGVSDDLGYRVGRGIGALGLLLVVLALGFAIVPQLFYAWHWVGPPRPPSTLVPWSVLLVAMGGLFVYASVLLCSDKAGVVMHRRELAAYFYSPIAYFVLFGLTAVAYLLFVFFIGRVLEAGAPPLVEPIVSSYIIQWWPIICLIFLVPVMTMRLLSEEKRSGTLEVLLTGPVEETATVLSKFFAALVFFLLIWVPWGLFLVALRVEGGQPFDYRPLLSFFIALAFTGSSFLSMGLFFSSLTRNQIISAVLTFAGMLVLFLVFFAKGMLQGKPWAEPFVVMLNHISFVDLWISTLEGKLIPKFLLFPLSATIMWLFMTIKVMEARRWT